MAAVDGGREHGDTHDDRWNHDARERVELIAVPRLDVARDREEDRGASAGGSGSGDVVEDHRLLRARTGGVVHAVRAEERAAGERDRESDEEPEGHSLHYITVTTLDASIAPSVMRATSMTRRSRAAPVIGAITPSFANVVSG
jgi:hypothetical protein